MSEEPSTTPTPEAPEAPETFPWVEVRNIDDEIYLGYWDEKALIINVDFGSCFLQDGQGLAVGDGAYYASVVDGKWDIKEASSFKKSTLPANSILDWDPSEAYHKALGVISDEEKESQRMMEMIQAQMANMPQKSENEDSEGEENIEEIKDAEIIEKEEDKS